MPESTSQKKYYDQIKEYAREHEPKEEKQVLPMSILLTADELAEKFIFEDGVRLDFEQCYNLLKSVGEVSEHKRAYNYIMDTVASNSFRFNYDPDRPVQIWGERVVDGKQVEIRIIGSKFSEIMRAAGFQDKAFLAWAQKNNLLGKTDAGRFKKKRRISGCEDSVWVVPLLVKQEEEEENGDFMSLPAELEKEMPWS